LVTSSQSALLAVAALSLQEEDLRRGVVDAGLLPAIVGSLRDTSVGVRAAACQCVRALSRSVNILRTSLVDAGAAVPLFELLREDEDDLVKITATAAVSNLLLDFSPMKKALLERSAIPRLVDLTHSSSNPVRYNSLTALKNVVYWAPASLKQHVAETLGWDWLVR
jgi:hypothetical protein